MHRILMMEDNIPLALEWHDAFVDAGFDVVLTHKGETAIEMVESMKFDLVITDIFVLSEVVGGLSLIGKLLQMGEDAPPSIVVTGKPGIGAKENYFIQQAKRIGANKVLRKPILPHKLVEEAMSTLGVAA